MIRLFPAALAFALTLPGAALAETAVTPIADAVRGAMVTVQGTVDRVTDEDEFRLSDASGDILIYIGPNAMPVAAGDQVTVQGRVDDGIGPREIYAQGLTLADGTVVTLDLRYD